MISPRIRFHLDENVDHAIADGLQRYGVDVTHDDDFLVMHSQGHPHAGIAYCAPDTHPIGYIIQALLLIWGAMEPDEMTNHVEFL